MVDPSRLGQACLNEQELESIDAAVRARPGGGQAPAAFPIVNRFCVALLYGRAAGRLADENGGFRPGQRDSTLTAPRFKPGGDDPGGKRIQQKYKQVRHLASHM